MGLNLVRQQRLLAKVQSKIMIVGLHIPTHYGIAGEIPRVNRDIGKPGRWMAEYWQR